ncbi:MAG: L28 family ribosomal protein [bacterium]
MTVKIIKCFFNIWILSFEFIVNICYHKILMPCYHCDKTVVFGRSHTHHRGVAGGRWKKRAPKTQRIFEPNLQRVIIMEDNKEKRVKLCTKCMKRIKKDVGEGKKPFLTLKSKVQSSNVKSHPKL